MKVLINFSNIKVGGGLQAATSVILDLLRDSRGVDWLFIISTPIQKQLKDDFIKSKKFVLCDLSPFNLYSVFNARKILNKSTEIFEPDLVFSFFGPVFWKPKNVKHLIGFANAWLVSPKSKAYSIYPLAFSLMQRIKNYLLGKFVFDKNSYYVTEVEWIKTKFCEYFNAKQNKIFIVGNTVSHYFYLKDEINTKYEYINDYPGFKFLTVSHNYPHKNLKTIEVVGQKLLEQGKEFKFFVTLSEDEYDKTSELFKSFTFNLGVVDIEDCPSVYKYCDALYLPTLIECFTVSYLEAMHTNKPIFTSDMDFAKNICGEDAFYFDPYDEENIFKILNDYLDARSLQKGLPEVNYTNTLKKYGDITQKVDSYIKIINEIKSIEG